MINVALRVSGGILGAWVLGFALYTACVLHRAPYDGTADGIVVLTGGDGRVEAGLRLLASGKGGRLLISGVHRDVRLQDINKHGAPADKIDLGFIAQDTLGNAMETASWAENHNIRSLIVVTSDYHMPRALVHLGSRLSDVTLHAYPVTPKSFAGDWMMRREPWRLLLSDYNKFLLTYPQILFLKAA
jgi:uncharacterized SAM-binding protein YcdF (DUF218 family)